MLVNHKQESDPKLICSWWLLGRIHNNWQNSNESVSMNYVKPLMLIYNKVIEVEKTLLKYKDVQTYICLYKHVSTYILC